jgi:hypothetical protein
MSFVHNIEGNLASQSIIELIHNLYSNLPIHEGIEIFIKGDSTLVNGFLKHVEEIDPVKIASNLGYEYIKFITVNNNHDIEKSYSINTSNYDEELEIILINYI